MAPPDSSKPKRIGRLQIGANVLVQVGLILFLAAMVNYLGFQHYKRWDLSRDKKYQLSDKTERFLGSIKGKIRVTMFFGPNHPLVDDVQGLLTQYQYASRGKIDVEIIDPERNISRAKELFDKYKVVSDESLVVVDYEGRSKTVKASEMAELDQGNPIFGEAPKVVAFKGEQAVTGAMIDLVEGRKNVVGYVIGHKEPAPAAEGGITILKQLIENENIQLQELSLFEVPAIPSEIQAIFINGPQYDFSEREMQLLRDYWNKQGRILLLIDPSARTTRLTAFLGELGLRVNDDRLMAMMKTGIQEVVRVRDVIARFMPGTAVTSRLADVRAPLLGGTSSMVLELDRARAANVQLQPIIQAEKGYWGEVDHLSTDDAVLQFDQGRDHGEPLTIGALIEKGAPGDNRVQVNSARMVVVTNAEFIKDTGITQDQQALDFVSASLNWLMNREELIGIAPKVPQTLTFNLDEKALSQFRWLVLVLIPLLPALAGLAVWWRRRT